VNFALIIQRYGHGFRAFLAQPEMLDGIGLAPAGLLLPAKWNVFSSGVIEINPKQMSLVHVLKSCGTTRVETLRQHGKPR
jgi:hypothetical protein